MNKDLLSSDNIIKWLKNEIIQNPNVPIDIECTTNWVTARMVKEFLGSILKECSVIAAGYTSVTYYPKGYDYLDDKLEFPICEEYGELGQIIEKETREDDEDGKLLITPKELLFRFEEYLEQD